MRLPRPRYTILSLMVVVLVASLILAITVAYRRRAAEQVAIASAHANYLNAQLTRQVAEIVVTEYTEGILKYDLEAVESEILLAKTHLMRAEEGVAAAKREQKLDDVAKSFLADQEKDARRAKLRLQQAQERKTKLATTTKQRILKELNDEVDTAKADELAKKAVYEQLRAGMMGSF
jgi:HlyD family secretion protein